MVMVAVIVVMGVVMTWVVVRAHGASLREPEQTRLIVIGRHECQMAGGGSGDGGGRAE
ncbi:hypothetical protein [Catellatospora coxensis]|uniref:hypothetical protein n=1 Tax=Catellatospora coxensis TaxID=310354 RepID=UPI0019446C49|nr:hypothetical protein [Catellatospora coxensis]